MLTQLVSFASLYHCFSFLFRIKMENFRRLSLIDLFFDGGRGLGPPGSKTAAGPAQCLIADHKGGGNDSLALTHETLLLDLLNLGSIYLKNVIATLDAFVEGEQNQVAGFVVQVAGGLLHNGKALIDAIEGLVAEGVGAGDVRGEITVRLGKPREDGSSKGLVSRVTEFERALSELVGLDSVDAVADDWVGEKVLQGCALATMILGP